MLGRTEIFDRSVLDFVLDEDLDFVADLMNAGRLNTNATFGPSRLRYVDAVGCSNWTQVCANVAPAELDRTLEAAALAARAVPLCGRGAILVVEPPADDDATRFRVVGAWPIDATVINAFGTPWRRALVDDTDADVDDLAVGDAVIAAAAERIASTMRRADAVYRTGGGEDVVVCEAMTDDALYAAEERGRACRIHAAAASSAA